MINRTINLITLLTIVFSVLFFAVSINSAWNNTSAWDQGWAAKREVQSEYSAKQLTHAMQKASEAKDFAAEDTLRKALAAGYKPTGKIFVRLTTSEILHSFGNAGIPLLLLILPLSLNYIRHNKVRIWNRNT